MTPIFISASKPCISRPPLANSTIGPTPPRARWRSWCYSTNFRATAIATQRTGSPPIGWRCGLLDWRSTAATKQANRARLACVLLPSAHTFRGPRRSGPRGSALRGLNGYGSYLIRAYSSRYHRALWAIPAPKSHGWARHNAGGASLPRRRRFHGLMSAESIEIPHMPHRRGWKQMKPTPEGLQHRDPHRR